MIKLNAAGTVVCEKKYTPLEKLFTKIFKDDEYNILVRPENDNGLTHVDIELKLLQIDLVIWMLFYTSFFILTFIFNKRMKNIKN